MSYIKNWKGQYQAGNEVTIPDNFINSNPLADAQLTQVAELVNFSLAY